MIENEAIQREAIKFSQEFNLDSDAVERALLGTLSRIKHAIAKGEQLNANLVEAAACHYFDKQKQFYNDLLENKDGAMDSLSSEVYEALKSGR
jgi:hypothetical protein